MAESVSLQVVMKMIGTMAQSSDNTTLQDVLSKDYSMSFSNGTGASQMNMWWNDQRTLVASATEDLDLAGSLTTPFGTSITFTSLKGLFVYAASGNTNDVQVTRPGSNGVPWLMAAGDGIALKPGMWVAWFNPNANGATVTAGTGDLITFTNSAGSTSVTYDVYLFGEV
jgi:hypothetical protein